MQFSYSNQPSEPREVYLAEVSQQLHGRLSPLAAFETTNELREHINAMADAYIELGMDPEIAMASALERFGPSGKVGSSVAREAPASRPKLVLQVQLPISLLLLTFVVAMVASLGVVVSLYFAFAFLPVHSPSGGTYFTVALAVSLVISPIVWFFWRLRPSTLGLVLAVCYNVAFWSWIHFGNTMSGEPGRKVYWWLTNTILVFVVGWAVSMFARFLRTRFPDADVNPVSRLRVG